jgi:2-polyprenyl-6-methoxyphenol hydroxylase-like FAD-dependent oxidoreductase
MERREVLIVGAGPTGLALAVAMCRQGVRPRVIERLTEPAVIAKATAIMPRTLEVLDTLGCGEQLRASGLVLRAMTIWNGEHEELSTLSFDGIDSPYPMVVTLPQSATEAVLAERLAELGGTVEREVELVSFSPRDDGVGVVLGHAHGTEEAADVAWLVGCDGAHSVVRHGLAFPFPGGVAAEDHLVVHAAIDWDMPGDRLVLLLGGDGLLFGNPLPDGRWILTGNLRDGRPEERDAELSDYQALLDARAPAGAVARDLQWASFFRVPHRQVPAYQAGRAFLAGDAAHVHSPLGGQGMNTGIQDAANLGWKLAWVVRGDADGSILDTYDPERHPVGKAALEFATKVQEMATLHHPVLRTVRNTVLAAAGHLEAVRQMTLDTMGEVAYSYRGCGLSGEHADLGFRLSRDGRLPNLIDVHDFAKGPHAGARALDVSLPGGTLYERLNEPGLTALLFEGTHRPLDVEVDLIDIAARLRTSLGRDATVWLVTPFATSGDGMLADPFQRAHIRYGARGPCLYLVRPDGHVLWRSQPPDPDRAMAFLRQVGIRLAG